MQTSKNKEISK